MTLTTGPTVMRRKLGRTLAEFRSEARVQRDAAALKIDVVPTQITHFETGLRVPRKPELEALLVLYGRTDQGIELEEMRLSAKTRGWWATYHLPTWLSLYIGLESDAVALRCWALELVPGLVQTCEYAEQTLERHGAGDGDVRKWSGARMERQRRIGDGLTVQAVLSEAVLWRTLNMGEVGAAQLVRLHQVTYSSGVDLRVLPFTAGGHRSMAGSFTVMDFPPGTIKTIGYQQYAAGGSIVDKPSSVTKLDEIYHSLLEQSLTVDSSRNMLACFVKKAEGHNA